MTSPFEITVPTNTVALDNKREGMASFTVKNNTRRRVRAVTRLITQPPDSPASRWLTLLPGEGVIDPAQVNIRDFPIDSTQTFQVRVAAPVEAAPGSYAFKLVVADEINPDENYTASSDITFSVREIPKPEPKKFPVWVIPVILVVILVIAGIAFGAISYANQQNANATATQVALDEARIAADNTATAIAVGEANARATETAVALDMTATAVVINSFTGGWRPEVDEAGKILSLQITGTSPTTVSFTFTTRIAPDGSMSFFDAREYTITNVPFSAEQMSGTTGGLRLTVEPLSGRRLFVSTSAGAVQFSQVFVPRIRVFDPRLDDIFVDELQRVNPEIFEFMFVTPPGP